MRTVFPGQAHVAMSESGPLSDSTRKPGKSLKIRLAVAKDLNECGLSRAQVAYALSGELGYEVSVPMIEAIVAETKANRMPAEWLPAWVKATGSRRLLDLLCEECGLSVATQTDRDFAEFGRHEMAIKKLTPGLWEKS